VFLVTFRRAGELIGLMPLYRHPESVYGRVFRGISQINSFEGDCPGVIGPERPLLWAELRRALTCEITGWDVLTLAEQEMDDHALIHGLRQDPRYHLFELIESHRYLSDTEMSYDEFFARLSRSSRTEIKRKIKKSEEREPPLRLECHAEVATEAAMMALLDRYVAIERKTWKIGAGIGLSNKKNSLAFYRDFLPKLAPQRIASLWFLKDGERDIASLLGYHYRDTLYMAQTTFDPEYAEFSPGLLATKGLLEYACAHPAIRRYDPLATAVNQGRPRHKTAWSTQREPIPTRRIVVFRKAGLLGFIGWCKKSRVGRALKPLRGFRAPAVAPAPGAQAEEEP